MAGNLSSIKQRIRSIQSTRKTTKAMEVVANAKLAKAKKEAGKSSDYTNALIEISNIVLSGLDQDCVYTQANPDLPKANIIITSDMGLCGGYNANLLKLVQESITDNEFIYIIGSHEVTHIKLFNSNVLNETLKSDNLLYEDIRKVANTLLQLYTEQKIGGINVFYTRFINTLTFEPTSVTLLPFQHQGDKSTNGFFDFEPNGYEIAMELIPMMVTNNLWEYVKESKLSEYAARRAAMESANNNAQDMIEELTLKYNQARQSAITTQISEIVAGANAT